MGQSPLFKFYGDLENKGTIHVIPRGQVVFKNILGQEVGKVYLNLDQRKVLPRGVWHETLKIETNDPRAIGPIKAELTVVYGLTQNQISDITSFWYFPNWVFYMLGPVIVLIIIIITILIISAYIDLGNFIGKESTFSKTGAVIVEGMSEDTDLIKESKTLNKISDKTSELFNNIIDD